jgi:putative salt-induced outer membrane protein YdiY
MLNSHRLATLTFCCITAISSTLSAEEETPKWKHEIDVGINGSTGNSKTINLHLGYTGSYKDADHRWKLISAHDKAKSDGEESSNQFYTDLLKDWYFNDSPWIAFLEGRYDWDEFKDWDYRTTVSSGAGYEFIDNDSWNLTGRLGLGGNKTYGDADEEITAEALFALEGAWTISGREAVDFKTTFYPSLEESGEYRNISTFNWKMTMLEQDRLAMKIGLRTEYDSSATAGTKTHDFKYNVSLVWGL